MSAPDVNVDWFKVMTELDKHGRSNAAIAKLAGISRTQVYRIKMGESVPSFDVGAKILIMLEEVTGISFVTYLQRDQVYKCRN